MLLFGMPCNWLGDENQRRSQSCRFWFEIWLVASLALSVLDFNVIGVISLAFLITVKLRTQVSNIVWPGCGAWRLTQDFSQNIDVQTDFKQELLFSCFKQRNHRPCTRTHHGLLGLHTHKIVSSTAILCRLVVRWSRGKVSVENCSFASGYLFKKNNQNL